METEFWERDIELISRPLSLLFQDSYRTGD